MKNLLLLTLIAASFPAFSSELKDLYVTQAGCRVYEGRDFDHTKPGIQNVEVWMYLSEKSPEYGPEENKSGTMYLEDSISSRRKCEELYQIFKNGRKAKLELEQDRNSFTVKDFALNKKIK